MWDMFHYVDHCNTLQVSGQEVEIAELDKEGTQEGQQEVKGSYFVLCFSNNKTVEYSNPGSKPS